MISVQRGSLCPGESLCAGDLCPGRSLSREVPVQGVSVRGSLSREVSVQGGLCPGRFLSRGSLSGDLCPGRSLSREVSIQGVSFRGSLSRGSLPGTPPHTVKGGRNAFYWNAFLFVLMNSFMSGPEIYFVLEFLFVYFSKEG